MIQRFVSTLSILVIASSAGAQVSDRDAAAPFGSAELRFAVARAQGAEAAAAPLARTWRGMIVPAPSATEARRGSSQRLTVGEARPGTARPAIGANAVPTARAAETQLELAAGNAVKLVVDHSGWFEVPASDVIAAGIDRAADPRKLQLYEDGVEIPITVVGEEDRRLDAADAIRFHGTPNDTPYSGTRTYWLISGRANGLRVETARSPRNAPLSTDTSFQATVERRDELIYFTALLNGDADSFFGPIVWNDPTAPARQVLTLRNIDRTVPTAELEIALQGGTDVLLGADPAHRVAVTVNGHAAGEIVFLGLEAVTQKFTIPGAWLREGENVVELLALHGWDDVSVVDTVRITYAHTYAADDGGLLFTASGGSRLLVSGFGSGTVRALDITDAAQPFELAVSPTAVAGTVEIALAGSGRRVVQALEETRFARVERVEANEPSELHASTGGALVVIAPESLRAEIAPLVARRQAQGLAVVVASPTDIYDELSFGSKDPAAIRSFLSAARLWATPATHVLLVGDASLDPRDHIGGGAYDLVPTKLVNTEFGKTASDGWLADVDGDGVADLAVGRLPARTPEQLRAHVAKIFAYESAAPAGSWARDVLFVSGDDPELDFRGANDELNASFGSAYSLANVDMAAEGAVAARQNLLQRWNAGAGLINFYGHGSVEIWQYPGFFGRHDALALQNGERLPLVVAMTCLNGYFHDVWQESLAEGLLRAPNGGAAAVWTLSSLTYLHHQMPANRALIGALTAGSTFGEATVAAQRATPDRDVRNTLLLFGDPSMRMQRF